MRLLFQKVAELQETHHVATTILRDLVEGDKEMDSFMSDNGFFKMAMPDNHVVDTLTWSNHEEFLDTLTKRSRWHFKQEIERNMPVFEIRKVRGATQEEIEDWYRLYLNVKERSLMINTFTLPFKLFESVARSDRWEVMVLECKPEFDHWGYAHKPVAVMMSYVNDSNYNFVTVGLDYQAQSKYRCYNQALLRILIRAKELNLKSVNLGFTACSGKAQDRGKGGAYRGIPAD